MTRTFVPVGITIKIEAPLTDMWLDADHAHEWSDEELLELVREDLSGLIDDATFSVERDSTSP